MKKSRKIIIGVVILAVVGAAIASVVFLLWQPPTIPQDHEGRTTCFECHQAGVSGAPQMPSSHLEKIQNGELQDNVDDCLECHDRS